MDADKRVQELHLQLPTPPKPMAVYKPVVQTGNLLFVSGHVPLQMDGTLIKGKVGTQSLDVVPPNSGDEGGIVLTVNGGGTYCVSFGGRSSGTEAADTAIMWKVINPPVEGGCVSP